jgi:preprotein translocase subunit SecD
LAVAIFIIIYYTAFGGISVVALAMNLLLLVGLLSILQATLTLPGMAALALTVGMAIDANVLINERIRDELRSGASPQLAIHAGFERAFGTIVDSNITTLIAGIASVCFRFRSSERFCRRALSRHFNFCLHFNLCCKRHCKSSLWQSSQT